MSDTHHLSDNPDNPDNLANERDAPHPTAQRGVLLGTPRQSQAGVGDVHLLFGAVEDLLRDLTERGGPDNHVVRVERIARSRATDFGGTTTLGIAVTARREDEILSCWVVVARLSLDPWGQPPDRPHARNQAERHREAQRLIGARFADAGFDVRLGLYRLPDDCYGFAATFGGPGDNRAPTTGATGTGRGREHDSQEDGEQHA